MAGEAASAAPAEGSGGAEAESRLDAPDDLRASAAAEAGARSPSSMAQLRNYPRPERSSDEPERNSSANEDVMQQRASCGVEIQTRTKMLRFAVRAASGAVAGAALLNLSRATCEPSPSERARKTLDAELRRRGAADAARNLHASLTRRSKDEVSLNKLTQTKIMSSS